MSVQDRTEKRAKLIRLMAYVILRLIVALILLDRIIAGDWDNVFMCVLTLILFMMPALVERRLKIDLPNALEIVVLLFIFAAQILGEIGEFYLKVPYWDTMLHTINGFIMAAVGFAMVDILNRSPRVHISLSPIFMAFVAFCFSMTIGVFWEFLEYAIDRFLAKDMQKDTIVTFVNSINLNPAGVNSPVAVRDITRTVISGTVNGEAVDYVIEGGYLDIGLLDTMQDLFVNLIGAAVFSIIGMFYVKGRGGRMAKAFIPRMLTEEELDASKRKREERLARLKKKK